MLVLPEHAFAHHAFSSVGFSSVEPRSTLALELQGTEFDIDSTRGRVFALTPSLEYAISRRFSLFGRVPLARVELADGRSGSGMGAPGVGAKVSVIETHDRRFVLSLGLGLELPLGDTAHGLGSEHFELAPFVAGSLFMSSSFALLFTARDQVALETAHHHHHDHVHTEGTSAALELEPRTPIPVTVLAPHTAHEVGASIDAAYLLDPLYAMVGADVAYPFQGGLLKTSAVARLELGLRLERILRFSTRIELPLAGDRLERRATLGAAWMF